MSEIIVDSFHEGASPNYINDPEISNRLSIQAGIMPPEMLDEMKRAPLRQKLLKFNDSHDQLGRFARHDSPNPHYRDNPAIEGKHSAAELDVTTPSKGKNDDPLPRRGHGGISLGVLSASGKKKALEVWGKATSKSWTSKSKVKRPRGMSIEVAAQNVVDAYNRADEYSVATGIGWYEHGHGLCKSMAVGAGISMTKSCAIMACMSPQTGWGQNIAQAQTVTKMLSENPTITRRHVDEYNKARDETFAAQTIDHQRGKRANPPEPPAYIDAEAVVGKKITEIAGKDPDLAAKCLMSQFYYEPVMTDTSESLDFERASVKVPPPQQLYCRRALDIFFAEPEEEAQVVSGALRGHKVRSFYNNLAHPDLDRDVTVDSQAFGLMVNDPDMTSNSPKYKSFSGAGSNKESGVSSAAYAIGADAYRTAAQKINEQRAASGLEPLTIAQVQAVTWIQWRKENPQGEKRARQRKAKK